MSTHKHEAWACDHLWREVADDPSRAEELFGEVVKNQLYDTNYGFDVPVCAACAASPQSVPMSRGVIEWTEPDEYEASTAPPTRKAREPEGEPR